jgi:hypothetical protein
MLISLIWPQAPDARYGPPKTPNPQVLQSLRAQSGLDQNGRRLTSLKGLFDFFILVVEFSKSRQGDWQMKHLTSCALITSLILASTGTIFAQPGSEVICSAAQNFLARTHTDIQFDSLLASESLTAATQWNAQQQATPGAVSRNGHAVYFAYLFNKRDPDAAGAVSIKVSVVATAPQDRTPSIELYRPAIAKGSNRCEPRGRTAIEGRHVRINEYIDYHSRRGSTSNIEDFHFRYPVGGTNCGRTDEPNAAAESFQFPDVNPTTGDTVASRIFGSYIGQSYALNHQYSFLKSELHYYHVGNASLACVGFEVPLAGLSNKASILIHDISSNWFSPRGSWLIQRQ